MSKYTSLQLLALIVFCVCLSIFGVQFSPKFEHFVSITDIIYEQISEFNEVSLVMCTTECAINWACVALLFSPHAKSCKTLKQYINANGSKESEDWRYYTFLQVPTCLELHTLVPAVSGEYRIYPWRDRQRPVDVYCDIKTQGGGWTAIQRRFYATEKFNRTLNEYKKGFGLVHAEYWLGNDIIHHLTVQNTTSLYISITLTSGTSLYERYDQFYITDEADGYRLQLVGTASGSLGDNMRTSFSYHYINGMKFSTVDRDNDLWSGGACGGGWWFNYCGKTCLNADDYFNTPWYPVVSNRTLIRETMMLIK